MTLIAGIFSRKDQSLADKLFTFGAHKMQMLSNLFTRVFEICDPVELGGSTFGNRPMHFQFIYDCEYRHQTNYHSVIIKFI